MATFQRGSGNLLDIIAHRPCQALTCVGTRQERAGKPRTEGGKLIRRMVLRGGHDYGRNSGQFLRPAAIAVPEPRAGAPQQVRFDSYKFRCAC